MTIYFNFYDNKYEDKSSYLLWEKLGEGVKTTEINFY